MREDRGGGKRRYINDTDEKVEEYGRGGDGGTGGAE